MPNRRLYTGTEVQTLDAGWWNADGTATIYLTGDPSLNEATLTLTNRASGPVVVAGGSPVAFGSAPEGAGALYLYFNGLLTNDEVRAIAVDAEGWSAAAFTDEVTGLAYLALAPAAAVTLEVSRTLTFAMSQVTATGSARAGNLTLVMAGTTGAPLGSATQSIFVNVAAPPPEGSQRLELLVGFAGQDFVFTGGTENDLLLVLTNPGRAPLVPGGADAWEGDPPTFTLSFVFADGGVTDSPGSLTDLDNAAGMTVSLSGEYGNAWQPVSRDDQGGAPTWTLQPDPNGGGQVLGIDANASVSLRISGLRSYQPAGATYAYLSYANLPGYADGYFAAEIVKVRPVTATLAAAPSTVANATSATDVTLSYAVENATYATITNTGMSRSVPGSASGSTVVSVAATTVFTLLASNHFTGQTVAASTTVTISPDLFGLLPGGTVVMWSGPADAPPAGWALCDGTNGTPDLRNRFVLGAGTDNPIVGTSGGSESHSHTGTVSVDIAHVGDHRHGVPSSWYANTASSGNRVTVVDRDAKSVSDAMTQSAGAHTHDANASVAIDSAIAMPPWYALAFIMKTS